MLNKVFLTIFTLLILCNTNISAQNQIWLSGNPPEGISKRARPSGMQHYYAVRGERGKEFLILWFKENYDIERQKYSRRMDSTASLYSFGPNREKLNAQEKSNDLGHIISYSFEKEGFHNIYYTLKTVKDSTLFIHTAKAERLNHKCRNGHRSENIRLDNQIYPKQIDFELVRERIQWEDFHTILEPGNEMEIKAYLKGKPLQKASIQVSMDKGWNKKFQTDENGAIQFLLINDYFPDLHEIDKKKAFYLLLSSEYQLDSIGSYQNSNFSKVIYTSNLEVEYKVASDLYNSKLWGLLVLIGSIMLFTLAIILLRNRKSKKYRLIN